jgi:hypothetical protein
MAKERLPHIATASLDVERYSVAGKKLQHKDDEPSQLRHTAAKLGNLHNKFKQLIFMAAVLHTSSAWPQYYVQWWLLTAVL